MRRGLFRRVVGRGRARRSASRASASVYRNASGKQYRVVAVDEEQPEEFPDPPRKLKRLAAMAASWIVVLALGAWVAPGFAASGSQQNEDPRDEEAADAIGAAWSYLRYGSTEDLDRAQDALCEGAAPELTPSDLDAIRQSYVVDLGGLTDVDLETGEPIPVGEGLSITATVFYISQDTQRPEEFTVSVKESSDGSYCVIDATQPDTTDPSADESSSGEIDRAAIVADYIAQVVGNRDVSAATAMQCDNFLGITAVQLDTALGEWEADNGWKTGSSRWPAENAEAETSDTKFDVSIKLEGDIAVETFDFVVGVQGDCVSSVEGGEGLVADPED